MRRAALALLILAVGAGAAWGFFSSGNHLLEECSSGLLISNGYCMGYVVGVADSLRIFQSLDLLQSRPQEDQVCIPDEVGVKTKQLTEITKRYLEEHPESRHMAAVGQVWSALAEAFPCEPSE